MIQYCVYTWDPQFLAVFKFLTRHNITREIHSNRTRFWIDPTSPVYTEFALRWASRCPQVLD